LKKLMSSPKIPKRKDGESAVAFLARLDKAKMAKPVKRDFDIKRQKVAAMEKASRKKVEKLMKDIKAKKAEHGELEGEFTVVKNDPVFQKFRTQLGHTVAASNKLQDHRAQENALKDKKRDLRKVLGKYRSLKEVEDDIETIRKNIEGGLYTSLKEERTAIQQMKKLNRLRSAAGASNDLDNQITQLKDDDGYKADQKAKKEQEATLKDIKQEKASKEQDKTAARTKMNGAWEELMVLRTKKSDMIDQAKKYQEQASQVSKEYRNAEKQYEKFMQVYRNAEQAARKERIKKKREQERQEADEQSAAFDELGRNQLSQPDDPGRNSRNNNNKGDRPQSGQGQKPNNAPQQNQGGGGGGGGGFPPKKRNFKKKDKDKRPEEEEKTNMKDVVIPFHEEIEQFEALEGYLQLLMPRAPPPQAEQTGRRKKRRKQKKTGSIKHNLNWLNAFSNAKCSALLPNRREKVEECLKELSAKLVEVREKSKAELEKRAGRAKKAAEAKEAADAKKAEAAAAAEPAQQEQEEPAADKAEPATDADAGPDQEKAVKAAA